MKDVVLVFARVPRLGTVKRRLAIGAGARTALRFHRTTLFRLLRRLLAERRFATVLCLTPDRARLVLPAALGRRLAIRPQGTGDLGTRMARAFRAFPHRRVALVGSDIPALGPADLCAAFAALGRAEAAFGPAADGGYWLVAQAPRRPARPFAAIRWSGPHALRDTLRNFRGRRVAMLRTLRDVDTDADLSALQEPRAEIRIGPPARGREGSGRTLRSEAAGPSPSPSHAPSRCRCNAPGLDEAPPGARPGSRGLASTRAGRKRRGRRPDAG